MGLGFWLLLYVATDLLGHRLGARRRVLCADAAAGQVHAVRVRIEAPVRKRYETRGDKPGTIKAEHTHWLEVSPVGGGRPLQVCPMYPAGGGTGLTRSTTDLLQAGLQLGGHQAWMCLPTRWKLIEKGLPVALVADTGHVVWGVLPTSPDRPSLALAGRAKFRRDLHGRQLLWLLAAFALAAAALLGAVTGFPGSLLCLGAAVAVAASGLGITRRAGELPGEVGWTVRESRDPAFPAFCVRAAREGTRSAHPVGRAGTAGRWVADGCRRPFGRGPGGATGRLAEVAVAGGAGGSGVSSR
ncbi:hypothetical protein [Streptomyces sp. NPDC056660]|uniref:hypothetical protein n=1 Tax=Streptomyces sp. NPDC056660 TaxID=3345897 RepID=UPI0036C7591E